MAQGSASTDLCFKLDELIAEVRAAILWRALWYGETSVPAELSALLEALESVAVRCSTGATMSQDDLLQWRKQLERKRVRNGSPNGGPAGIEQRLLAAAAVVKERTTELDLAFREMERLDLEVVKLKSANAGPGDVAEVEQKANAAFEICLEILEDGPIPLRTTRRHH